MDRTEAEALSRVAVSTGEHMLASCKGAPAEAPVQVPVADFQKIAGLLRQLGGALRIAQGQLDPDGFRFWLPLPQIEARRAEVEQLRERVAALNRQVDMQNVFRF